MRIPGQNQILKASQWAGKELSKGITRQNRAAGEVINFVKKAPAREREAFAFIPNALGAKINPHSNFSKAAQVAFHLGADPLATSSVLPHIANAANANSALMSTQTGKAAAENLLKASTSMNNLVHSATAPITAGVSAVGSALQSAKSAGQELLNKVLPKAAENVKSQPTTKSMSDAVKSMSDEVLKSKGDPNVVQKFVDFIKHGGHTPSQLYSTPVKIRPNLGDLANKVTQSSGAPEAVQSFSDAAKLTMKNY